MRNNNFLKLEKPSIKINLLTLVVRNLNLDKIYVKNADLNLVFDKNKKPVKLNIDTNDTEKIDEEFMSVYGGQKIWRIVPEEDRKKSIYTEYFVGIIPDLLTFEMAKMR